MLRTKTQTGGNLLSLEWPNQSFNTTIPPVDYDPAAIIYYNVQPTGLRFTVNNVSRQLNTSLVPFNEGFDYSIPEAVYIEANDRIRVIFSKRIYTTAGWQTVQINALYEKYTSTT